MGVLDDVDRLEAQGEYVEAIDLIMAQGERERSAELECRLAWLRSLAFALESRPPVPVAMPPTLGGRLETPPEVEAGALSGQLVREALGTHGCVLVRGLVPVEWIDLLVEDIDRAFEARAYRKAGVEASPSSEFSEFEPAAEHRGLAQLVARDWLYEVGGLLTADSPRALFDYARALRATGTDALVGDYFGERPAILVSQSTMRRVQPGGAVPDWHQDGSFVRQRNLLNIWLALSDCGTDAPGLEVLPARLPGILPTGTAGASATWTVAPAVVDRAAGRTPLWQPRFHAGDALLFDELFLHRVHNRADMIRQRYSIETWFFAPSQFDGFEIPMML